MTDEQRVGARGRKSASELITPPRHLVSPELPIELPEPPDHLSDNMRAWWRAIVKDYDLEPHHLRLLEAACDAWDRMVQARTTIVEEGLTVEATHGRKTHPACNVERDSRAAFARLVRELDLDEPPPRPGPYMPPPAIRSNRRR
jgi:P27 family predicted phage terminase small subunit